MENDFPPFHVEVVQKDSSVMKTKTLIASVSSYLITHYSIVSSWTQLYVFSGDLSEHVESISFGVQDSQISLSSVSLLIHVFKLDRHGLQEEDMETDESSVTVANHWILPSADLQGLWENLIYEKGIKEKLLDFVATALWLSDKKVNPHLTSWNRIVLLHGPPGTGKTSLCKAIAQKLSIQHSDRYTHGQLLEINSHSLFSKWFSESGKLVHKMFSKIQELVEDPKALVIVLIDEVESLASLRDSGGQEPGDAIRVVNALLTAIDGIKSYPNVVIFTTSNITGSIDGAFMDRADIKQYIGHPTPSAVYQMLRGSLQDFSDKGIIRRGQCIQSYGDFIYFTHNDNESQSDEMSKRLMSICEQTLGLSGRTIRKLPFLAAASSGFLGRTKLLDLREFLSVLEREVQNQHQERESLKIKSN